MFGRLLLSIKVQRLERSKQRISRSYEKEIREARAQKKDEEEINHLQYGEMWEIERVDDEIYQLENNFIINRAQQYLLPRPEFKTKDGDWEESSYSGRWRLTEAAFVKLRAQVRAEEKERREHRQGWVIWVTAITGVVGALTGLMSIILGHGK